MIQPDDWTNDTKPESPTVITVNAEQIMEGRSLLLRVDRRILELALTRLDASAFGWLDLRNYVAEVLGYNVERPKA